MASQQVLFAETIAGMKKAFKRKVYDSDSDSEIENYGNRGHKLKRRARFAHRGQLVPAEGPSAYKEDVDYAGVRRSVIHRKAPLVDWEGYEVYSDDDEDRIEEAVASAAELDPYANIRLENVLAPLTASTDLPTHPTLSQPFTSKNLTDLVEQSSVMMRRENESLWRVRHLWTELCGDRTWVPCETMIGPDDVDLYTDDHVARHLLELSKDSGAAPGDDTEVSKLSNGTGKRDETRTDENGDIPIPDAEPNENNHNATTQPKAGDRPGRDGLDPQKSAAANLTNGNASARSGTNGVTGGAEGHGNAGNAPSITSEATEEPFVHPMFLPPTGARPDRNLGLPEGEAEDVRRLLSFFIQKQEEVCRGARRLHDGLSRAQRLRKAVLHWSKAEAHSGENRDMSDGEDWYDKEEWELTEDLKKGQDDEEEDTTTTSKKTRARR